MKNKFYKYCLFFFLLVFIGSMSFAKVQISDARYFIDSEANGYTNITITPGNEVNISEQVDLNSSSLSDGLHSVFLQFKNDSVGWGPPRGISFIVSSTTAESKSITDADYYFDDISNGTTTLTPVISNGVATVSMEIDVSALSEGIHTIYIRYKDNNSDWGPARGMTFIIAETENIDYEITAAEYFVDNVVAEGNGTSITVSPTGSEVSISEEIDVNQFGEGFHTLYLRFYDDETGWGPVRSYDFNVSSSVDENLTLMAAEYFFDDNDLGPGNNTAIAAPADGMFDEAEEEFDTEIPVSDLADGEHYLFIRTQSSDGHWGPARGIYFRVDEDAQPVISNAEYFFDSDPGEGNGIPLPSKDGSYSSLDEIGEIELAVSETGLDVGDHKVYVRFRNSRGDWGSVKSANFSIVVKPVIEISHSSIAFGTVFISDSSQEVIKIKNNGDADLVISDITVPAGYSTDWTSSLSTIVPQDSINVTVTFKPTADQSYNGNMVIENNDVNKTIALTGVGSSIPKPNMAFNPASPYEFGEVDLFTDISKSVEVSITNNGTDKLWISSVTSSNPDVISHDFSAMTDSLDIDASLKFNITFSPQDTVVYNEYLTIANNSFEPNYQYAVNGAGIGTFAPYIVIEDDSLEFGTVQTSATLELDLEVMNTGTIDLDISSITSTSSDFQALLTPVNKVIEPGTSKSIPIRFVPSDAVAYTDTLYIISNDIPHSPKEIIVTGIGSADPVPNIMVSADEINFGNIPLEDAPVTRNLTIANNGTADLTISSAVSDNNAFSATLSGIKTITAGSSWQLPVSFNPQQSERFTGTLTINNDDPDIAAYEVLVSGSSVFPEIFVSQHNFNFGEVGVTQTTDLSFKIYNEGQDTLVINEFVYSVAIDSIITITPINKTILADDDANFSMVFSPEEPIEYQGEVYIINNDVPDTLYITGVGYDDTPPEITFEPDDIEDSGIESGTAIGISAPIADNNQIVWAKLFYKQGGKADYDSVEMEFSGEGYNGEIPQAYVSERGVDYYIKAFDGANYQTVPATAPEIPAVCRITVPSLPPLTMPASDYQMFSIPSELANKNANELLEQILGTYDINKYRLFRWVNGNYVELADNPNFKFDPGKAYWLITKEQEVISIDTSVSVKTNENYIMSLDEGWNQVGTPFYFSVNWEDVFATSPNIVQGLVAYEYDSESGNWVEAEKLERFKGYFVYTPSGGNILRFPPVEAVNGLKKSNPLAKLNDNEWQIRITATSGELTDNSALAGTRIEAAENWDILDRMDPPQIQNKFVNVRFNHRDWDEVPGLYGSEFKPITTEGQFYDFQVVNGEINAPVCVSFNLEKKLPESFQIQLLDLDKWTGKPIESGDAIELDEKDNNVRNFRIIAGKQSFIEANNLGIGITPTEFRLSQNYPNPFNPVTTIQYDLPEISKVKLCIYNYLGQEVTTLVNDIVKPGYYQAVWDGRNDNGNIVASGIYLYVIQAGNHRQAKKMVMLK